VNRIFRQPKNYLQNHRAGCVRHAAGEDHVPQSAPQTTTVVQQTQPKKKNKDKDNGGSATNQNI
jgi:hypothetical protein